MEVEVKLRVSDVSSVRRKLARLGLRPVGGGRVHEMNTVFDTPQGGLAKNGQLLRIRIESPGTNRSKKDKKKSTQRAQRHREPGGERAVLTYKGPAERAMRGRLTGANERYKIREEREVELPDPATLKEILEAIGLRGWFRYEKYRTTYRFPKGQKWTEGLLVELDETPIGDFVELEGPRGAIDRAAELLGFHRRDYITKSYLGLYIDYCRGRGIEPRDMVFPGKKK